MKRVTHFKGYDSIVEYDQESQTFVSKPLINKEQQPASDPIFFVAVDTQASKRIKKRPKQKLLKRTKNLAGQQAVLIV